MGCTYSLTLSLPSLQDPTPPLAHPFPQRLSRPEVSVHHTTTSMLSSHLTPEPGAAAYRETSAQLAIYSRAVFEFTLRLWSESRKRAEELRRLEESAAILNLSLPPQVRTGSMRSAHKVDTNSQQ